MLYLIWHLTREKGGEMPAPGPMPMGEPEDDYYAPPSMFDDLYTDVQPPVDTGDDEVIPPEDNEGADETEVETANVLPDCSAGRIRCYRCSNGETRSNCMRNMTAAYGNDNPCPAGWVAYEDPCSLDGPVSTGNTIGEAVVNAGDRATARFTGFSGGSPFVLIDIE